MSPLHFPLKVSVAVMTFLGCCLLFKVEQSSFKSLLKKAFDTKEAEHVNSTSVQKKVQLY